MTYHHLYMFTGYLTLSSGIFLGTPMNQPKSSSFFCRSQFLSKPPDKKKWGFGPEPKDLGGHPNHLTI